ncbi:MAG: DUF4239 domain-containing protein [Dehalococcoidia bacterium]|nr:DUF4239 domain-containing protein [Dehalococcoidia bacterium]MDD5493226.1 DUF4239 domain-containing protein [Dehalococcoidia bacterium]
MPLQQWILLSMPTWFIAITMILVAVGTAVGGVLLVHRFVNVKTLKSHHDIAGPIFATIGVVYAVMLSYVLVIVWQNYDRTSNNAIREANLYADIYRDTVGFSEPFRTKFRAALGDYLNSVVNDEWKELARGQGSLQTRELNARVWELTGAYEPATEGEKIFFAEMLRRMNDAGELRRQRIIDAQAGIHPMLWIVLLFGGLITVVFSFFFGSDNLIAQLIMTTLLSVLIMLILFTILVMDFPFSGDISVSPASFEQILQYLK